MVNKKGNNKLNKKYGLKRLMYRYRKALMIISALIIFAISPFFSYAKSIAIMFPYSLSEKSRSIMETENINLRMPGGINTLKKDWYPFVMTFNDDLGLSRKLDRDVRLSILYNFGAFDLLQGSSSMYNEDGDYLNAFYGAYIVKDESKAYGYNEDGTPNLDEIELVTQHDMGDLVLYSIGKMDPHFDAELVSLTKGEFLDQGEWDMIDSTIYTNSVMHQYKEDHLAYIQYGKPHKNDYNGEDFKEIELQGRIYGKYFPKKKCSIFFYIIAPNWEIVEYTDEKFLQKSELLVE